MKLFRSLSIRKKLVAIQIMTACIVLVLAGVAFVVGDIADSEKEMLSQLSSSALIVGQNCVTSLMFMDEEAATQTLSSLNLQPHITQAAIYDEAGAVFAVYSRQGEADFIFPSPQPATQIFTTNHIELFEPIVHDTRHVGTIYLRADMTGLREKIKDYVLDALIVLAVGLTISLLLSFFFQKNVSNPILNLAAATRSVSETDDYSRRVQKESDDELGELCDGFNKMLEQIQHRDSELREARDTLERRVEERTREVEELSAQNLEQERALRREMEKELQTAHDMQMSLMPKKSPQVPGFDLAGRCNPASDVGGDYFQYFRQNGRLSVSLADVTGHAMEAAVPVMMFSGLLKSQMEIGGSLEEIFGRLNRSLHGTLDRRTFICFAMGELDIATRTLHLSNGGCPYPYYFQASTGEISELQLDAYPLAIRPDSEYRAQLIQLEQGDRIVLCSDGIIEAENKEAEIFGFERTAEEIQKGCIDGLSADALIERLMEKVNLFSIDVPQGDDMTCVVLNVSGD